MTWIIAAALVAIAVEWSAAIRADLAHRASNHVAADSQGNR